MKIAEAKQRKVITLAVTTASIMSLLIFAMVGHPAHAQKIGAVTPLTAKDYFEIEQLYYQYTAATDSGNGPARAAVFTSDGKILSHINKHVPEGMDSMAKRTGDGTKGWGGRHRIFNILIVPTDEGASGSCYAVIGGGLPNKDGTVKSFTALYRDILVRTPQGWRFKSREIFEEREPTSPFRGKPS